MKERTVEELFKLIGAKEIKGIAFKNLTLDEAQEKISKAVRILMGMYKRISVEDMPKLFGMSEKEVQEISSHLFEDRAFLFAVSNQIFDNLMEALAAQKERLLKYESL